MTISENLSTSRGSELYFNNLLKLGTATLTSDHMKIHRSRVLSPTNTGLSCIYRHSHPALGLALTVTGAHHPTLDSLALFSHRDFFSVDWVEVRTLILCLVLCVSVAKSLALLGLQVPHLWTEYSTASLIKWHFRTYLEFILWDSLINMYQPVFHQT